MAKKKLFKVAKELNVASDTLITFLEKKGVQVKGPNTSISDEDYQEILEKFSIEKEKADKLHAKREKEKEEETAEESTTTEVIATTGASSETAEADVKTDTGKTEATATDSKDSKSSQGKSVLEERLEKMQKRGAAPVKTTRKTTAKKKVESAEDVPEEVEKTVAEPVAEATPEPEVVTETTEKAKAEEKKPETEAATADTKDKKVKKEPTKESMEEEILKSKKKVGKNNTLQKLQEKRIRQHNISAGEEDLDISISRKKRKKRKKQVQVDQTEVDNTVKKTLAQMSGATTKKKKKKMKQKDNGEVEEVEQNVIAVTEFISAQDLASLMDVPVNEVLAKAIGLGMMITINQRLELDIIEMLADEFEYSIEVEEEYNVDELELEEEEEDNPEDLVSRPPVVTIMGHVDHGKTSLLDYIRKSNVVDTEAGGITQHIGAYQVDHGGRKLTFLDTPGHEAFTAMRARGAQATDIAIIVVAADDAVMPQTIEAIDHAKSAEVPMVFAVNKMDKPGANPDKIFQQLSERNILVEDWGGNYQVARVSAKKGEGIEELLEKVLLESELLELKTNVQKRAKGTIIEAKLDRGKGATATVLVQEGHLQISDSFVAGNISGRVRAMFNDRGDAVSEAGPSVPVQVLGFESTPQAGDRLTVMKDERAARDLSTKRQQIKREQDFRKVHQITLDDISKRIQFGEVKELNIIVKGDVDGSVEALSDSLMKMSNDEVAVMVVRKAVGQISEADVMLASASNAIIIGFHVRPSAKARELAETEKVDIRTYKIVYDAISDVKQALEGLLSPDVKEQITGYVEVRDVFKISKVGSVAGGYVREGRIKRNAMIRLIREGIVTYEGRLSSLKRFQDDVAEVKSGFECGLMIDGFNDIKVGDEVEAYEKFEEKRTLA
jgi:translation initiation factor IF-2